MTFFLLYKEVILEAFIWGAGTAIGELPPYFVARAAAMAGERAEEIDSVLDEMDDQGVHKPRRLISRMKTLMMKWLN